MMAKLLIYMFFKGVVFYEFIYVRVMKLGAVVKQDP